MNIYIYKKILSDHKNDFTNTIFNDNLKYFEYVEFCQCPQIVHRKYFHNQICVTGLY